MHDETIQLTVHQAGRNFTKVERTNLFTVVATRHTTQPSVTRPSLALLRCAVQTARTRRTAQPTSRPCLILLGVCRGSSTTASLGPVSSHRLVLPSSLGVATGEKWEKTELTPLKWDGSVRSILDQWSRPESKRILRGGFNPSSACLGNNHPQN
jgi:hypothetical protein